MTRRRILFLGMTGMPLSLTIAPRMSAGTGWPESFTAMEKRIFEAVNAQRANVQSPPLIWDDLLTRTAREHSRRMIEAGFFGHDDPQYGDLRARLTAAGVPWWMCAENVFREKNYSDPVSIAIVDWMHSEGHRRNLLSPEYTLSGVGVAAAEDGTMAMTQQFLTPIPKPARKNK